MDLTPPSLSTSPALSEQKLGTVSPCTSQNALPLEASAASYPSPTLFDFTYRPVSPYQAIGPPSIIDSIEVDASLSELDRMAQGAWTPSDVMEATTSTASMSNILPAHYEPFGHYQPCFTGSYGPHDTYPPPTSIVSTLTRSPAPSMDASSSRNSLSVGPSGPFNYSQDPTGPRIKIEGSNTYSPALGAIHYPVAAPLHIPYDARLYLAGDGANTWSKQELQQTTLFPTSTAETASLRSSTRGHDPTPAPRTHRSTRKHTTKEQANFQCQVKGCGKFFSRSYNFKSHMETHDEKREYPFLCHVNNCNKKFVRKTDLQRHHQSVHMKERNHGCDYCGRLFGRKDTLRRHMEDGCSRRFDIGTLDIQAEGLSGGPSGSRATRAAVKHLSPDPALTAAGANPLSSRAGNSAT